MPTRAPRWSIVAVWRPVGLEVEKSMIIVGLAAIGATVVAALLLGLAWVGRTQAVARAARRGAVGGAHLGHHLRPEPRHSLLRYARLHRAMGWLAVAALAAHPAERLRHLRRQPLPRAPEPRLAQRAPEQHPRRLQLQQRRGSRRVVDQQPDGGIPGAARAGGLAIAGALIISVVINGLIVVGTTWFDGNAKALAAIPNIVAVPASQPLPPTNVDHIVLVTQAVASYLGQQTLASGGQNLGSVYHTEPSEYTLQSVRGHLYWIAPLVYNNVWANLGNWQSPGYVVVDAEDPNTAPQLRTGYHMRYLPDALFNQDLLRHVYLSGYTWGDLVDPTLEVDDNWRPYFTISLMQPTRGFTGEVVKRVLVVDSQTGAIANDALGDVPSWVDRIIPAASVDDYLNWWGKYAHAPWFNPSGQGQQIPATSEPELVYNQVNQPVWLEPMTSSAASDNSSTGVVLFDTRDMTGQVLSADGPGRDQQRHQHLQDQSQQHPQLRCRECPALPDLQ